MATAQSQQAPVLDFDPFAEDVLSDPYAWHDMLRDAGPVVYLPEYKVYGTARYEHAKRVLSDWETFCSSRGVGLTDFAKEKPWRPPSLLLERDPPLHDRTRSAMNKVVALPRLKKLAEDWQAEAERLVDELVSRRTFDAVTDLAEAFPLRIFPATLGLPAGGDDHLIAYAYSTFNAFGPQNAIFRKGVEGLEPSLEWIAQACKYDNLAPGKWGQDIHHFAAEAGFEEAEREVLVRSFLSAGVDTTINGIGNLLYAFAQHPAEWARLRADRKLVQKAFEEGLRWLSTAQNFMRTTTRDVEIEGVLIPEGSKVIAFLAAANRDPRHWPDADKFDISRVASGHVGFGFGIHQCLGQMLARQEAAVLLSAMADRIAEIRLVGDPQRRLNNTLFAFSHLPVEIIPA
jgi:cytochrome P450